MESLQLLVVAFLAGCITAATLVLALHAATDPGRDSTQMRRRQPDKAPATTVAIVLPPARPAPPVEVHHTHTHYLATPAPPRAGQPSPRRPALPAPQPADPPRFRIVGETEAWQPPVAVHGARPDEDWWE